MHSSRTKDSKAQPKQYVVYLLQDTKSRATYIGSTNDFNRRIRQHNGEIKGGAKRTRGRQWRPILHVCGFKDRKEATSFETCFQRIGRRRRHTSSNKKILECRDVPNERSEVEDIVQELSSRCKTRTLVKKFMLLRCVLRIWGMNDAAHADRKHLKLTCKVFMK